MDGAESRSHRGVLCVVAHSKEGFAMHVTGNGQAQVLLRAWAVLCGTAQAGWENRRI